MLTNEDRAEWGQRAIAAGTVDYGANGDDLDGLFTDAGDAITNILHKLALAAGSEMNDEEAAHFARDVLRRAELHFSAEITGDEEDN